MSGSNLNKGYDADWTHGIQYAASLTPQEMALRDLVVKEYLYDHNWTNACMRCGFNGMLAQDYAQRFAQDPYIAWKLREFEKSKISQPADTEENEAKEMRIRIIESLKREADYRGPGSSQAARVAALDKLSKIYGLEAGNKSKVDVTVKGGVMMVPTVASVEDWEKVAYETQQQLLRDTADGAKSL